MRQSGLQYWRISPCANQENMTMSRKDGIHLDSQSKLELLRQVMSPVGASDLVAEIDYYTFQQLRDLRDILHIIAQGKPNG